MIVVDSSVWIDFFRGLSTAATDRLETVLLRERLAVGDLILMEVLQGFDTARQARSAEQQLARFATVQLGGRATAVEAAENYRTLRRRGVTVRSTIDTLIATACIRGGHTLLHSDRDFDAFEKHLGLRTLA